MASDPPDHLDSYTDSTDAAAVVRSLMTAAGLQPSEDELAALISAYPAYRAAVDRLYSIGPTWITIPPSFVLAEPPPSERQ